jgi:hypothetical protein
MKTLFPVATALALVAAVNPSSAIAQRAKSSGFGSGTQNAQEVADQSGLRDVLADLAPAAACRRASACRCRSGSSTVKRHFTLRRKSGLTPVPGQAPSLPPNKSRRASMLISFLRTSLLSLVPAR